MVNFQKKNNKVFCETINVQWLASYKDTSITDLRGGKPLHTFEMRVLRNKWERSRATDPGELLEEIRPFLIRAYETDPEWTNPYSKLNMFGWIDANRHEALYISKEIKWGLFWERLLIIYATNEKDLVKKHLKD